MKQEASPHLRPGRGEVWWMDLFRSSPPLQNHVDLPAGDEDLQKITLSSATRLAKWDIRRFRSGGKVGEIRQEPCDGVRRGPGSRNSDKLVDVELARLYSK